MKQISGILILLAILAWGGSTGVAADSLTISGTGDSQVVLRELARLFEADNPDIRVVVPDSVGSGGGIKALLEGMAGLARTARPLKPEEAEKGLVQEPFALSPIVFASHPSQQQVGSLSAHDVIGLYEGGIKNWRDLGGEDHKLYLVARETGDSSRKVIDAYYQSQGLTGIGPAGKVFYTTGDAALALARNPYTIGYLPYSVARHFNLHILAFDRIVPDAQSISDRRYPLVTTLYLITPADPGRPALAFLDFVRTAPARYIMLRSGVFPAASGQERP